MGVGPSVTFELTSATPYHLRYLMTDMGQPGATQLLNAEVAPPGDFHDLRMDALTAAGQGAGGLPLLELLRVGVPDQGSARHSLLADASVVTPNIAKLARANCVVTPKVISANGQMWAVDADLGVGTSAGFPVLSVTPPGGADGIAYLDIHFAHSYDDGPEDIAS